MSQKEHLKITESLRKVGEIKMNFTEEEVYAIFAFIRNHEKEDIPEDIWDISERIYEWMYENS